MARPLKRGLDYFPLDTVFKGKIEYIQCMYGMLGVMVIVSLLQRIYSNSYYVEYEENSPLVFSKDFGTQLEMLSEDGKKSWEVFDEIVKKEIDFEIFDKGMYEKHKILTSKDIQETYLRAKEKSARVEIASDYLLLSDEKFKVFSPKTGVYGEETGVSSPGNYIKKSKENKIKVKKSKFNNDTDTNERDFSTFKEDTIREMLES